MTLIGGGGGNPDGTIIKVSPSVWNDTVQPVQTGNHESDGIKAALLITLNDLVNALSFFSFIRGATNLAQAISDFSGNIELTLGCIAVDMAVVASGLQVAATAFASLDGALVTTFQNLEGQMSYFTTDTTLGFASVATPTALQLVGAPSGGGGSFFGHVWHDLTNWTSDAYDGTVSGLEKAGLPVGVAVVFGGAVYGLCWVVGGAGAIVTAAP